MSSNPTTLKTNFAFPCALSCARYRIGAYAFRKNSNEGIKIDIIGARAGGDCSKNKSATIVIVKDHANIVHKWAERVRAYYRKTSFGSLRRALAHKSPSFAKRLPEIEADMDFEGSEYELLSYVAQYEAEVMADLQKELAPLDLRLEDQVPQSLRASIEDDVDSQPTQALPRFATGVHQNASSQLPLGQTRGLMQSIYAGHNVRTRTIREIAWRATQSAVAPAMTHRLEVVLANTRLRASQLSRDFARNLQGAQASTFFAASSVNMPALSGSSDPNRAMVWLKGQRPFVFAGPNLLVQTRTESSSALQSLRGRAVQAVDGGDTGAILHRYGWSCAGSLDIRYGRGGAQLSASGVAPGLPVLFMLGFDNTSFAGVVPLPMALDAFGMGDCQLLVDPVLQVSIVANRSGVAELRVPIHTSLRELELHGQALHVLPQKRSFATTGAVQLVLGASLCNEISSNAPRARLADRGPAASNRGVVMLYR